MPKKQKKSQEHNTTLLLILLIVSLVTNVVVLSMLANPKDTPKPMCADLYEGIVPTPEVVE